MSIRVTHSHLWRIASACLTALTLVVWATPAQPQSVTGVVRESSGQRPVASVEVTLMDSTGRAVASVRTLQSGEFKVNAPGAARYRMTARRLGFKSAISPWFFLEPGAATSYDFLLDPAPQELAPVTTQAQGDPAQVERRFGLDVKNINAFIVSPEKVQEYRRTSSGLADIVRQIGIPGGISVREEDSGEPCIMLTGRDHQCMLIVVDNLVTESVRDLDLTTIEDIVIMRPSEAGLWYGSLSTGDGGVHNPNQRATKGGVLLIRTKMRPAKN